MELIATLIAGLVLAGAATASVIVTQQDNPASKPAPASAVAPDSGTPADLLVTYDAGQ